MKTAAKKIDTAIELLVHYNLTLLEIAYQLNFRNVEEFSNQFIKRVGLTPEHYRQLRLGH